MRTHRQTTTEVENLARAHRDRKVSREFARVDSVTHGAMRPRWAAIYAKTVIGWALAITS